MNLDIVKKFEQLVQSAAEREQSLIRSATFGKCGWKKFQPLILKYGGTEISREEYNNFDRKAWGVWPEPKINVPGDFGRFRGSSAHWNEEFVYIRLRQQYGNNKFDWKWLYFKIPSDIVMKVVVLGGLP